MSSSRCPDAPIRGVMSKASVHPVDEAAFEPTVDRSVGGVALWIGPAPAIAVDRVMQRLRSGALVGTKLIDVLVLDGAWSAHQVQVGDLYATDWNPKSILTNFSGYQPGSCACSSHPARRTRRYFYRRFMTAPVITGPRP
jgi:hypothetical protein